MPVPFKKMGLRRGLWWLLVIIGPAISLAFSLLRQVGLSCNPEGGRVEEAKAPGTMPMGFVGVAPILLQFLPALQGHSAG